MNLHTTTPIVNGEWTRASSNSSRTVPGFDPLETLLSNTITDESIDAFMHLDGHFWCDNQWFFDEDLDSLPWEPDPREPTTLIPEIGLPYPSKAPSEEEKLRRFEDFGQVWTTEGWREPVKPLPSPLHTTQNLQKITWDNPVSIGILGDIFGPRKNLTQQNDSVPEK